MLDFLNRGSSSSVHPPPHSGSLDASASRRTQSTTPALAAKPETTDSAIDEHLDRPSARACTDISAALRTAVTTGEPLSKLTGLLSLLTKALDNVSDLDERIQELEQTVAAERKRGDELQNALNDERKQRSKRRRGTRWSRRKSSQS